MSQDFLTRNNLLGKCIRGPKIVVRIANEQRISTSLAFSPTNVSFGQKKFTGLNFIVLPHLRCVDFFWGLPAMKELNMSIQPSKNVGLIGDIPFSCDSKLRQVLCLLVDSAVMQKIFAKAARNKHTKSELFLVSFRFAEELECIKTNVGPELDIQLKELVTEFAHVTQEPQGLHPHRGIFDHKTRLTAYPKRQHRNRLFVPEYEELKIHCTDLFKQPELLIVRMPASFVMVQKPDCSIQICVDNKELNKCIVKDSFPLPRIDDLLDKLRIAKCITHLDLRLTYN